MTQELQIESRLFAGPNAQVPYAAVSVAFTSPFPEPLPADTVVDALGEVLSGTVLQAPVPTQAEVSFEHLAKQLAGALHDLAGSCDLGVEVQQASDGRFRLVLGFHDPQAAMQAAHVGVRIAHAVFARARGGPQHKEAIEAAVGQTAGVMRFRQPDPIARAIMGAARERGIPVYVLSPGSRVWRYGQGSAGLHFFEAGNHRDSGTGITLTRDKFLTNQLVLRLGLPGVQHGIAGDVQQARALADRLEYPVVVKPVARGKGLGVSAGVSNAEELASAFAKAIPHSGQGVLIERQIPGDDHRCVAIGGKFVWAVQRVPPRVEGDGSLTVEELIERENRNRSDADVAAGFVTRLQVDADMLEKLAKQELLPGDVPDAGRAVSLRAIANTATGGTIVDRTADVHPDNREMVETIARSFHLDVVGIDFMTTDVSKSWREVLCGVIEVNATPGFSSDARARLIMAEQFPSGATGRVPSVVLIGTVPSLLERVVEGLQAGDRRVGQTDDTVTLLDGRPRCANSANLPERVLALVLDAGCDALAIAVTPQDLGDHGFPLDRCDLAVIAEGTQLADALRTVIEALAGTTIADVNEQNFVDTAGPAVAALVGDSARPPST